MNSQTSKAVKIFIFVPEPECYTLCKIPAVTQVVEGTGWSNYTAAVVPSLSLHAAHYEWCGILHALTAVWVICWMCVGPVHGGPGCLCHHDTWTGLATSHLMACVQHSV